MIKLIVKIYTNTLIDRIIKHHNVGLIKFDLFNTIISVL